MYTVLTGTRLGLDWSIIILFNVLFSYVLSVKPSISSLDITETVNLNFYGLLRNTWRCVLHWFFFSIVTKRISERTCIWQWVCCCERMLSVTMLSSIDSYHVFWQFILVSRKNLPKGRDNGQLWIREGEYMRENEGGNCCFLLASLDRHVIELEAPYIYGRICIY